MKSQKGKNLEKKTRKTIGGTIILGKKNPAWEKIIKKVSGSRRKRLELNLDEIDGQTKDNDLVIIPGIVLGKGNIKKIIIVNVNEVVIVGKKEDILSKYQILVKKGGSSQKGPRIIRTPERILKRVIRGMLPHKQMRGRDALNNIRCYNEIPTEFLEVKKIRAGKEKRGKFILLKELSKLLN